MGLRAGQGWRERSKVKLSGTPSGSPSQQVSESKRNQEAGPIRTKIILSILFHFKKPAQLMFYRSFGAQRKHKNESNQFIEKVSAMLEAEQNSCTMFWAGSVR